MKIVTWPAQNPFYPVQIFTVFYRFLGKKTVNDKTVKNGKNGKRRHLWCVWSLGRYTRKIFKSICIILLIEMISWLTPNITSSVLRGMQLSTETYNAIYIPIASSAVSIGTSLFLPSLYWMRSLIFGHSSIAFPNRIVL